MAQCSALRAALTPLVRITTCQAGAAAQRACDDQHQKPSTGRHVRLEMQGEDQLELPNVRRKCCVSLCQRSRRATAQERGSAKWRAKSVPVNEGRR